MNLEAEMNKSSSLVITIFLLSISLVWSEQYRFSSDFLKSVMAEGKENTLLEGHVLVQSEKKEIKADKVEILGKGLSVFYM